MGVSSQGKSQIWSGKQRKYNFLRSDRFTYGRTNSDLDRTASFLEYCGHYDMLISNPDPHPSQIEASEYLHSTRKCLNWVTCVLT